VLIEDDGSLGRGPRLACRESLRDPDEDVAHGVAGSEDEQLARDRPSVLLGAHRLGVHGDRSELGDCPREGDGPGDRRARAGSAWPDRECDQPGRQTERTESPAHHHLRLLGHSNTRYVVTVDAARLKVRRLYTGPAGCATCDRTLRTGPGSDPWTHSRSLTLGMERRRGRPAQAFSNASDSASLGSRSGTSACRRINQPAAPRKHPPTATKAATSRVDGRMPSG